MRPSGFASVRRKFEESGPASRAVGGKVTPSLAASYAPGMTARREGGAHITREGFP